MFAFVTEMFNAFFSLTKENSNGTTFQTALQTGSKYGDNPLPCI